MDIKEIRKRMRGELSTVYHNVAHIDKAYLGETMNKVFDKWSRLGVVVEGYKRGKVIKKLIDDFINYRPITKFLRNEVVGSAENNEIILKDLFRYNTEGVDEKGRVQGKFVAVAALSFYHVLEERGIFLDKNIFKE